MVLFSIWISLSHFRGGALHGQRGTCGATWPRGWTTCFAGVICVISVQFLPFRANMWCFGGGRTPHRPLALELKSETSSKPCGPWKVFSRVIPQNSPKIEKVDASFGKYLDTCSIFFIKQQEGYNNTNNNNTNNNKIGVCFIFSWPRTVPSRATVCIHVPPNGRPVSETALHLYAFDGCSAHSC